MAFMPGHSRSKNGVASLAYVPGIHVLPGADQRRGWPDQVGHDESTVRSSELSLLARDLLLDIAQPILAEENFVTDKERG